MMLRRFSLLRFVAHEFVLVFAFAILSLGISGFAARARAQARVGDQAPAFTVQDSQGRSQSLAQSRGKYVVLEWHNQGCPYTRKHYVSGNMQALQKEWTAKGVV